MGETTRFAPSPTGRLHLGHALSAAFARAAAGPDGRLLLRIEDIDQARCRPEHAAALIDDLAWLGFVWSGPVRRQSERMDAYAAALARLEGEGLVYPCFCARSEIAAEIQAAGGAPQGPDGPLYPGTCRRLDPAEAAARRAAGAAHAWRLDMGRALARTAGAPLVVIDRDLGPAPADPARFGDVVLGRKDCLASYHLAATLDDADQGVTLVTRGIDLAPAAHLHRLLQALLGWPAPAYAHHPLAVGPDGRRLAKRDGAAAIASLRAAGVTPEAALARAWDAVRRS